MSVPSNMSVRLPSKFTNKLMKSFDVRVKSFSSSSDRRGISSIGVSFNLIHLHREGNDREV